VTGFGDGLGALVVRAAVARGDGFGAAWTGFGAEVRVAARLAAVVARSGVRFGGGAAVVVVVGTARVGAVVRTWVVGVVLGLVALDDGLVGGAAIVEPLVGELLSRPNATTAPALPASRAATATTPRSRCRELVGTALCRAMSYLANRPSGSDGPTPYARWAMTTTFRVVWSSCPVAR
jgi:hypothetical protein